MSKQLVRKELSRRELALRGVVTIVVVSVFLTLTFLRSTGTFGGPAHVAAQLADAGGSLSNGADVKLRGVIIGRVSGVTRGPRSGVRVGILIDQDKLDQVPTNVVARILPATVFGTSFVDLVVDGARSGKALRAGAVIPADSSQGTLELQQALDDIDSLVKAVGPAELASALGSVAQALDGRGTQLGNTIDEANSYLARLNPRMPQVRSDVAKLATNLQIAASAAPDLLRATDDALVAARTVVDQKAAIATLISGGTALTREANAFLRANRSDLIRFVDNSALLLNVVYTNRHAGITESLFTNRMVNEKLRSISMHGFLDTMVNLTFDVPSYYRPADCPRFGNAVGDNCRGSSSRVGVGAMVGGAR